MSAGRFAVGERVRQRPGAAEHDSGPGVVYAVHEHDGAQFVAVRHDGGDITSWWASDLEPEHRGRTRALVCDTPGCWMEGQPWAPAGGWPDGVTPRCESCGCRLAEVAR